MGELTVGSLVIENDQLLEVVAIHRKSAQIELENEDGLKSIITVDDFNTKVSSGQYKLGFTKKDFGKTAFPTRNLSEPERYQLDYRLELIQIVKQGRREVLTWPDIYKKVRAYCLLESRKRPSQRTLERWWAKHENLPYQNLDYLAPNFAARGNRLKLSTEEGILFYDIVDEQIAKYYLETDKFNYGEIVRAVNDELFKCARLLGCDFTGYSRRSVRRRISSLPLRLGIGGRVSNADFDQEMRGALNRIFVLRPYERVECDATPLDIMIADAFGNDIGKPTLYAAIDAATKSILAISLRISKPSSDSVLQAFEFMFSPKGDAFTEKYHLKNPWLAPAGIECIVLDNAAEHHSGLVLTVLRYLNLTIDYPQAGKPQKRPFIERWFSTLKTGLINRLPGSTTSQSKLVRDPLKKAMTEPHYTLDELEAVIIRWVADVYMQRPNGQLTSRFNERCSPAQAMEKLKKQYPILPPPSIDAFSEACLAYSSVEATLNREGVWCKGEQFQSSDLIKLYKDIGPGRKVQVCYYPFDISWVIVLDPRNPANRIEAYNKIPNLPVMSFEEAKAARKKFYVSDAQQATEAYHQSDVEMMAESAKKMKSRKVSPRNQEARKAEAKSRAQSVTKPSPSSPHTPETPSSDAPVELTSAPRRKKDWL